MCGIAAYFGDGSAGKILVESLKRLEYRGYDSAGVATLSNPGIQLRKGVGEVDEVNRKFGLEEMEGFAGVGHTRWSTHGKVSTKNAHPHTSCDGRFVLVHNGIIQNWEELKERLDGHSFTSETDSEVIAHFIEEKSRENNVESAIQEFLKAASGSFAVVLLDSEKERIYAFKRGSPLALGEGRDGIYLGSDLYAFSPYTNQAVFFQDDEYAVIDEKGHQFKDENGARKEKEPREFSWEQEKSKKEDFDHYMRKEIEDIPKAIKRLERSLKASQKEKLDRFGELMKEYGKIIFTASGTSYHASLLGVYFLQKTGLEAQTLMASEFKSYERVDSDTLVVPISQSGETRDVLDAVEYSRKKGADIASIVNVPHSTVERKSDLSLRVKAGQEICVASTKTFTSQLYLLLKLAEKVGHGKGIGGLSEEIEQVIEKNENKVKEIAEELKGKGDVYIIGRGETYPAAREIALKLKEIAYIHAESMMGGELKHGTLALIEEGTPVISLIPDKDSGIRSNVKEAEARGAKSIPISPFDGRLELPSESNGKFVFFSTILGFLLTYWIARKKGLPVDKPRNLSKSVTVS